MEFTELMRELQGGESQEGFAARIGVTQTAVSAIYRGARVAGAKVLRGLVQAFPERSTEIMASYFASEQHFRTVDSTDEQDDTAAVPEEAAEWTE
jgi:transcriptional regulator with XRE-family HTH domain